MVDVALEDGSLITATDRHPFWDASTGEFTYAIDLEEGELVLALDGSTLRIASVRVHGEDLVAYNLEIEGIHTYYAGQTPVLVHNTCGDGIDSQSLNFTNTVLNKADERPYLKNTLLIDEIMTTAPRPDPGGVSTALRWDAAGSFNGSVGSYGLVIDRATNTVLHFQFGTFK